MKKHFKVVCLLACTLFSQSLHSTPYDWVGASGGDWATPGNWDPNTGPPTAGDTAQFPLTTVGTITVNAGTTDIQNIIITTSSSNTLTLSGTSIDFPATGAISTTTGQSADYLITAGITIAAGQTLTFDLANAADTATVNGVISGATGILTKSGSGTLLLDATNTYGGVTNLNGGVLQVSSTNNLSGTSGITFNGGTLNSITNSVSLNNKTITVTGSGTLDCDSDISIGTGSNLTGSGTLTKSGDSTLTIIVDISNFTGDFVISAGLVDLVNSNAVTGTWNSLTLQDTGGLLLEVSGERVVGPLVGSVNNRITGVGSTSLNVVQGPADNTIFAGQLEVDLSFKQTGSGILTLSGNNTYTGTTTLSDGTLILSGSGTLGSGSSVLTMSNDAVLTLETDAGTKTIGGLTGAAGNIINLNNNTLVVDQDAGPTTYAGILQDASAGGGLTKSGTATLILTEANTYTGTTTLSEGGLTLTGDGTLGASSASLVMGGGTLTISGITPAGFALTDLSGSGTIELGDKTLTVTQDTLGTFSGVISGTDGSLIKNGDETLALTGTNTYTGSTTLNAGVLQVSDTDNLSGSSAITFNGGTLNSITNTVSLGNKTITMTGSGTVDCDSRLDFSLSSTLTGAGTLTKTGAGDFYQNADNTNFTGSIIVNEGFFVFATGSGQGTLSSLTLTGTGFCIIAGGVSASVGTLTGSAGTEVSFSGNVGERTLTVTQALGQSTIFAGNISGPFGGPNNFVQDGPGTLTLSGAVSYNGSTTLSDGTLILSGSATLGGGSSVLTMSNDAVLTLETDAGTKTIGSLTGASGNIINLNNNTLVVDQDAGPTTYAGVISGGTAGGFTKSGTGTLILTGNNIYAGTTTLTEGGLTLSGASATIGSGADLIVNGGTLDISDPAVSSVSVGDLSGTGGTIAIGSNTFNIDGGSLVDPDFAGSFTGDGLINILDDLTLSGDSSAYTGSVELDAGTLTLSNINAISGADELRIATGATVTLTTDVNINSLNSDGGDANSSNLNLGSNTLSITQNTTGVYPGIIAGTGGSISKAGADQLTITGTNTYTGTTTVSDGNLAVSGDGTIGNGSNPLTVNGGTLNISNADAAIVVGDLSGTGGTIELGSKQLNVVQTNNLVYEGVFSGDGTFNKLGGGRLTLSGDSSVGFTGSTVIADGFLTLNNLFATGTGSVTLTGDGNLTAATDSFIGTLASSSTASTITLGNNTLTVVAQADSEFAGVISGTGNFTKSGDAGINFTLSGPNNYTGTTSINFGELTVTGDGTLGASTAPLAMSGEAALILSTITSESLSVGTLSGEEDNTITIDDNYTMTITQANAADTTYAGTLIGNNVTLNITGAGDLTLSNNNSNLSGAVNLSGSGTTTLSSTGTFGSSTVTMSNTAQLTLAANTGTKQIEDLSSSSSNNIINVNSGAVLSTNQSAELTFAGTIQGAGGYTKIGSENFILTGANSYTGDTNLNNGSITLTGEGALGNGSNLTMSSNTTLDFSGIDADSLTIGDLTGLDESSIIIGSKDLIVTSGDGTNFSGTISGTGGLSKNGDDSLTLLGTNEYTGITSIDAGQLILSGTDADISSSSSVELLGLGSLIISEDAQAKTINSLVSGAAGTTIVLNNNILTINQTVNSEFAGVISSTTGGITKTGSGQLNLTGINTYSGPTTLSEGAVLISGAGSTLGNLSDVTMSGTASLQVNADVGTLTIGSLIGASGNTVSFGNAALVVTSSEDSTFAGTLSGTNGAFTKTGNGKLTLTGTNSYTGATTISAGELAVRGALSSSSAVGIAANAVLSGTGSVGATTNNGIVAPGASIGTLTINGNYTQGAGGLLQVELDAAGNTDLLSVTGTANLDGTLLISPEPGNYITGTTYPFLTANTVLGTFATTSVISPFEFSITYAAQSATLVLLRGTILLPVPTSALRGNARRVADYLFANDFYAVDSDFNTAISALVTLTDDYYPTALIKISPLIFGALPIVSLQSDFKVADSFTKSFKRNCEYRYTKTKRRRFYNKNQHRKTKEKTRNLYLEDRPVSLWAEPIFYYYNQQATKGRITNEGQPAFTSYTYGSSFGWNDVLDDQWALGFGVAYTHSSIYWEKGMGDGNWNTLYLAPSFGWISEKAYANLVFQTSFNFYKMHRNIHYGNLKRKANHRSNSYDFLSQVEGGYRFKRKKSKYSFEPQGRLGVLTITADGYTEDGADALNLYVYKKYTTYIETEVLLKFAREVFLENACFTPAVYMGWVADIPTSNGNIRAKLVKESTNRRNFHVLSYHQIMNQMVLGFDLPIQNFESFAFKLNYETRFFNHFQIQEVSCKFDWNF